MTGQCGSITALGRELRIYRRRLTRSIASRSWAVALQGRVLLIAAQSGFQRILGVERTVLARFLDNLQNSLTEFPGKIWLVYNNPTEEHAAVIADFKLFSVSQEFEPSGATYPFRVYQN